VQSTKTLIITSIKRSGGSTVDELAQALDLAPMTVRQHLAALQRDDLVGAEPVRRATGRPHYVYRLTQRGDDTFPKRYDRLAEALLQEVSLLQPEEIESLAPDEKASLVLRRVADRLVDAYAPKVRGRALEEQVATVTEMLHADGGFAEWGKTESGYVIHDYNCLFGRTSLQDGRGCEWHFYLLSRMLGPGVRLAPAERCDPPVAGCRYVIEP
jgi:predicted ArsR family transcriptional regulator